MPKPTQVVSCDPGAWKMWSLHFGGIQRLTCRAISASTKLTVLNVFWQVLRQRSVWSLVSPSPDSPCIDDLCIFHVASVSDLQSAISWTYHDITAAGLDVGLSPSQLQVPGTFLPTIIAINRSAPASADHHWRHSSSQRTGTRSVFILLYHLYMKSLRTVWSATSQWGSGVISAIAFSRTWRVLLILWVACLCLSVCLSVCVSCWLLLWLNA